jgi:hypothetical protein
LLSTETGVLVEASYVWLDGDETDDNDAALRLLALLDERGAVQHRFAPEGTLPDLPHEFTI